MKTNTEIAEDLLDAASSSAGVSEITVDGLKVVLADGALEKFERRAAREVIPSKRPISFSVDLSQ